jgi:hypothetical protein
LNEVEPSRGWPGVGRVAGYVSAGALLGGTILYLLDATDALGTNNYTPTGSSAVQNEAGYWVAQFAHQRHILWDIITRDMLFPRAFLTLIVFSLAVRTVVDADGPATQIMVAFFLVGGTIAILNDLGFLGATDYWRVTGWAHLAPTNMVATGRSEQAIESLTRWPRRPNSSCSRERSSARGSSAAPKPRYLRARESSPTWKQRCSSESRSPESCRPARPITSSVLPPAPSWDRWWPSGSVVISEPPATISPRNRRLQ